MFTQVARKLCVAEILNISKFLCALASSPAQFTHTSQQLTSKLRIDTQHCVPVRGENACKCQGGIRMPVTPFMPSVVNLVRHFMDLSWQSLRKHHIYKSSRSLTDKII